MNLGFAIRMKTWRCNKIFTKSKRNKIKDKINSKLPQKFSSFKLIFKLTMVSYNSCLIFDFVFFLTELELPIMHPLSIPVRYIKCLCMKGQYQILMKMKRTRGCIQISNPHSSAYFDAGLKDAGLRYSWTLFHAFHKYLDDLSTSFRSKVFPQSRFI